MREILFKAKRKLDGAWVVGDLSQHKTGKKFIKLCGGSATHSFEVDENTICQYTGLTDKNGNKIWENDVVLLDDEYWLVKWSDNDAQFTIEDDCTIENFGNVWGADCEVYGNIFDNADLLKGE